MEAATARLGRGRRRKKKKSYGSEERRLATLLLSPAMIVIALVAAYPIGYAVWLSLTEYSLRVPGKWRFVGFDNYTEAFGSTEFWDAFKNTFIFTGISVTLELVIGLGMALADARGVQGPCPAAHRRAGALGRTHRRERDHVAHAVRAGPRLGAHHSRQARHRRERGLAGQSGYAMAVMILADVWKTAPFMALLLLAGLQVIPDDVYDAAKVDGATTWQRLAASRCRCSCRRSSSP